MDYKLFKKLSEVDVNNLTKAKCNNSPIYSFPKKDGRISFYRGSKSDSFDMMAVCSSTIQNNVPELYEITSSKNSFSIKDLEGFSYAFKMTPSIDALSSKCWEIHEARIRRRAS